MHKIYVRLLFSEFYPLSKNHIFHKVTNDLVHIEEPFKKHCGKRRQEHHIQVQTLGCRVLDRV